MAKERSKSEARRVGERRKRAKKVFDPSENNAPSKRKRGRPAGSTHKTAAFNCDPPSQPQPLSGSGPICTVCRNSKNPNDDNEKLVGCRDCSNKAHPSCLRGDGMLHLRPDNTWQCPLCITCVVCIETEDAGQLTVCHICADAYHSLCHIPHIPDSLKSWHRWECRNCQRTDAGSKPSEVSDDDHYSIDYDNAQDWNAPEEAPSPEPTPDANAFVRHPNYTDRTVDPSVPDARDWTVDQVYKYFIQYFPEYAHIFKETEIDGRSLMVMRRLDAIKNLGLCLGPAVKIYRHIVKLQSRRDDIKMCWF